MNLEVILIARKVRRVIPVVQALAAKGKFASMGTNAFVVVITYPVMNNNLF